MTKIYCETCKEELTNPRFILNGLTAVGYLEINFCLKKECFIKYLVKKFKRQLKKELK